MDFIPLTRGLLIESGQEMTRLLAMLARNTILDESICSSNRLESHGQSGTVDFMRRGFCLMLVKIGGTICHFALDLGYDFILLKP